MDLLNEHGPLVLFFGFAIAHALADFPLQGDYLAREKVRAAARSGSTWVIALTAHSLIHAGAVWVVSGLPLLGAVELVLHWAIDWGKGEKRFGAVTDQLLHLACKAGYVLVLLSPIADSWLAS